ncbi:helix-turn-helix domain-containing protein [Methylobacterium sp. AMS5]|uniref:helix-turn-helix domain-containing protein n=1 Tax=Methylobacterium sp. AMS5 TaxID=925818 RepID=UPI00074F94C1|nr:helix-turn-helix domain-containing protein [Methylobacterium sp. AMS5]AMB45561.1 AraC family transcriptional regulator [Methylobacterium sp. AMS5]
MTSLQRLDYLTTGLPHGTAAEIWKGVVGPLFEPRAFHPGQQSPTGSASGAVIGDIMVARVVFGAQSYRRDRDLIARTPDHILFHLYNVGGFSGFINGQQTTIWSSQVAIIDLAQEVDTLAASSDTVALVVPRALLPGLAENPLPPRLDAGRNRLLAAHLIALRERSTLIEEPDAEAVVTQTLDFLRALLDPARAEETAATPTLATCHLTLAEQTIRTHLASPDLSPEMIANEIGVSRATLYRMFAPYGGIMRSVQERRLLAVRAALSDPLETRRLSRLATDFGFRGKVHFSRSFRAQFGITASEFRAEQVALAQRDARADLDVLHDWWPRLGNR